MTNKNKIIISVLIIFSIFAAMGVFYLYKKPKNKIVLPYKINNGTKEIKEEEKMDDYHLQKKAVKENDYNVCYLMIDIENKNSCISSIARLLMNKDICDNIEDDKLQLECMEGIDFTNIIEGENINNCDELTIENLKNFCYEDFFRKQDDSSYCTNIKYKQDKCYSIILLKEALDKKDINVCKKIPLDYEKKECQKNINNIPKDQDGDGLSDQIERAFGTDPFKADTDGDGISDYDEIK